jgi:hypothetical protein
MTIGDTIISSDPVSMIFDLQNSRLTLPESHYYNLKTYFLGLSSSIQCWNQSQTLVCLYCGESTVFPSLIFLLEDGTRFSPSRESYLSKLRGECYSAQFFFHNSKLSGADYIILGRDAMSQYYIVFQQLGKATAGITLYPHPVDNSPINDTELIRESYVLGLSDSTTNTVIENNPLPNNPDIETNTIQETSFPEPSVSSPEDRVSVPNDENNGLDNTILYVVIGTILIVMTCTFIILKSMTKREQLQGDQRTERQRSTVEMNESSYFVTTNQYIQNDEHDDEKVASE